MLGCTVSLDGVAERLQYQLFAIAVVVIFIHDRSIRTYRSIADAIVDAIETWKRLTVLYIGDRIGDTRALAVLAVADVVLWALQSDVRK